MFYFLFSLVLQDSYAAASPLWWLDYGLIGGCGPMGPCFVFTRRGGCFVAGAVAGDTEWGSSLAEWSSIPRTDPGSGTCKVGAICHPSLSCWVGGGETTWP